MKILKKSKKSAKSENTFAKASQTPTETSQTPTEACVKNYQTAREANDRKPHMCSIGKRDALWHHILELTVIVPRTNQIMVWLAVVALHVCFVMGSNPDIHSRSMIRHSHVNDTPNQFLHPLCISPHRHHPAVAPKQLHKARPVAFSGYHPLAF